MVRVLVVFGPGLQGLDVSFVSHSDTEPRPGADTWAVEPEGFWDTTFVLCLQGREGIYTVITLLYRSRTTVMNIIYPEVQKY